MNRKEYRITHTRKNRYKSKRKKKVRGRGFGNDFGNTFKKYFTLMYKVFGGKWEEEAIMQWWNLQYQEG